jgi:hypothetical protein
MHLLALPLRHPESPVEVLFVALFLKYEFLDFYLQV